MSDILTDKLTEINNHFVNDILEVIATKRIHWKSNMPYFI